MGKYDLTMSDIDLGIKRILTEAYATATISEKPELIYVSAGPGAGKTAIEIYYKKLFKEKGQRIFDINSDKIAEFHPQYEEALQELPEECYRITRQFVRPATPKIFDELSKTHISIINENTLDKGDYDIANAKKFKENGYKISVCVIATDMFESRLSCYEREAHTLLIGLNPRGCSKETQTRMYNSFISGIEQLDSLGLLDEINVYVRGENVNKPPILKYSKGDSSYSCFQEAISMERAKQRNALLKNPEGYLRRIETAKRTISQYGINETLTKNSLAGLEELRNDYLIELGKSKIK